MKKPSSPSCFLDITIIALCIVTILGGIAFDDNDRIVFDTLVLLLPVSLIVAILFRIKSLALLVLSVQCFSFYAYNGLVQIRYLPYFDIVLGTGSHSQSFELGLPYKWMIGDTYDGMAIGINLIGLAVFTVYLVRQSNAGLRFPCLFKQEDVL